MGDLPTDNYRLGNVKIKRGTFQGDSLSTRLFALMLIPLTLELS